MSLLFMVSSCADKNNNIKLIAKSIAGSEIKAESDAYNLLKSQCYICHSINSISHDSIIAPPMAAVKMRYSMQYDTKEEFVDSISNWVLNPTSENSLMKGAVAKFNVMPKLMLSPEDIKKIVLYIYENQLEEPEWFNAHQEEMHGNGQGMRMGGKNKKNK